MICFFDKTFCANDNCKNYLNCYSSLNWAKNRQEKIAKDIPGYYMLPYSCCDLSSRCEDYSPLKDKS